MRFPDAYDIAKGDNRDKVAGLFTNEISHDNELMGIMSYGSWHEGDKQHGLVYPVII